MTNLYVGNLSYSTSESKLRESFSNFGATSVRIIEGRGFGFVEVDPDKAKEAIDQMNETEIDGRKVIVNEAKPREERPRSGGNSRGGNRW